MQRRTLCILGGTGFVGRHLVTRLAQDGHDITVPTRNRERHRALLVLPTVSLVNADVHDPATLERIFSGCDAVINLVGILNERGRDGSGFRRAHVELARKVVQACGTSGVPRLLHMSALKADAANGPSYYLRSKGEAETIVRSESGADTATTILQPSVIFGPDDSFINRFAALLRLPSFVFPLPRANTRFAPVYVGDVAEAFARALDEPRTHGKTYQLCGPQVYSLRELVEMIARTLGLRRRIVPLSDTLARAQAAVMDFVPGKPFSTDNYLSLSLHSICDSDGLAKLGISAQSSESLVPAFLTGGSRRSRLSRYRRVSGR